MIYLTNGSLYNARIMHKYNQTTFFKSAPTIAEAPTDSNVEIAFVGRSNAGKSSAINAITGIKGLAKTSKTPGRTQLINFFLLTHHLYIVDLPGYGYAKVAKSVQKEWTEHLTNYIESREQLRAVVLIMDVRHPLTDIDQQMISWLISCDLSIHILLTKADKLTRNHAKQTLLTVQRALAGYADRVTVQLFSVPEKLGVDDARVKLDQLFAMETRATPQ